MPFPSISSFQTPKNERLTSFVPSQIHKRQVSHFYSRNHESTFSVVVLFGVSCRCVRCSSPLSQEPPSTCIVHQLQSVQEICLFDKNKTFLDKKSGNPEFFIYIPDFFREIRTLRPTFPESRMLEPEVRNGVWDSGIPDFLPDLVHLCERKPQNLIAQK